MIWPDVISCASPRPAVMRISVATIGWMPTMATRAPFQTPSAVVSASAAAMATRTPPVLDWSSSRLMMRQAVAPEIATSAPTERSIPPVAITAVIPSATSIAGAPKRRMSIRLP